AARTVRLSTGRMNSAAGGTARPVGARNGEPGSASRPRHVAAARRADRPTSGGRQRRVTVSEQQRLLVPLDGSDLAAAAVPYAEALARVLEAALVLFAALEREPGGFFGLKPELLDQLQHDQ